MRYLLEKSSFALIQKASKGSTYMSQIRTELENNCTQMDKMI